MKDNQNATVHCDLVAGGERNVFEDFGELDNRMDLVCDLVFTQKTTSKAAGISEISFTP